MQHDHWLYTALLPYIVYEDVEEDCGWDGRHEELFIASLLFFHRLYNKRKVIPDSVGSPFSLKFKVIRHVILRFSEKILRSMSTIDRKSSP